MVPWITFNIHGNFIVFLVVLQMDTLDTFFLHAKKNMVLLRTIRCKVLSMASQWNPLLEPIFFVCKLWAEQLFS